MLRTNPKTTRSRRVISFCFRNRKLHRYPGIMRRTTAPMSRLRSIISTGMNSFTPHHSLLTCLLYPTIIQTITQPLFNVKNTKHIHSFCKTCQPPDNFYMHKLSVSPCQNHQSNRIKPHFFKFYRLFEDRKSSTKHFSHAKFVRRFAHNLRQIHDILCI